MGCPENLSSAPRKSFCVPQGGLLDVFLPVEPDSGVQIMLLPGCGTCPGLCLRPMSCFCRVYRNACPIGCPCVAWAPVLFSLPGFAR